MCCPYKEPVYTWCVDLASDCGSNQKTKFIDPCMGLHRPKKGMPSELGAGRLAVPDLDGNLCNKAALTAFRCREHKGCFGVRGQTCSRGRGRG